MRFSSFVLIGLACPVTLGGCSNSGGDQAPEWTIDAGALKLRVTESPWNMAFFDAEGNPVLIEHSGTGEGPTGSLAMHLGPPPPGNG